MNDLSKLEDKLPEFSDYEYVNYDYVEYGDFYLFNDEVKCWSGIDKSMVKRLILKKKAVWRQPTVYDNETCPRKCRLKGTNKMGNLMHVGEDGICTVEFDQWIPDQYYVWGIEIES